MSARRIIRETFPETRHLTPDEAAAALAILADARVRGGAVYDGLVGLAALSAGLLLVSCDQRAVATYQALAVRFEILHA